MTDKYLQILSEAYDKSPSISKVDRNGVSINNDVPVNKNMINAPTHKPSNKLQDIDSAYPAKEKIDVKKDLRIINRRDIRSGVTVLFAAEADRFWGFNIHYLHLFPAYKNALVRLLMNQKRGRGGFSYRRMQRFFGGLPPAILKYCIKEYLFSHIVSKVKFVPETYLTQVLEETPIQLKKMSAPQVRKWITDKIMHR